MAKIYKFGSVDRCVGSGRRRRCTRMSLCSSVAAASSLQSASCAKADGAQF